jgi:predicted RNase H-like nuclease (RuvC/YqgF family)
MEGELVLFEQALRDPKANATLNEWLDKRLDDKLGAFDAKWEERFEKLDAKWEARFQQMETKLNSNSEFVEYLKAQNKSLEERLDAQTKEIMALLRDLKGPAIGKSANE